MNNIGCCSYLEARRKAKEAAEKEREQFYEKMNLGVRAAAFGAGCSAVLFTWVGWKLRGWSN